MTEPKFKRDDLVTSPSITQVKSKVLKVLIDDDTKEVFYFCEDEGSVAFVEEKDLAIYKDIVKICDIHNERCVIGTRRVVGVIFSLCHSCAEENKRKLDKEFKNAQ